MSENYFYSNLSAQEIENTLVGAVVYNKQLSLTTSQKAQARANIGAGEVSTGLIIKGYYDTAADLESAHPMASEGDAYMVGTEAPYDVYIWDAVNSEWVNNGVLTPGDSTIDDNDISLTHTWSSSKINNELASIDLTSLISDSTTAANKTWSSNKISTELSGKATPEDVTAIIDDSDPAENVTWSSQKIADEIGKCKWKLVWQNPSPTSNQAEATVTVDLSAYKQLLFIFNRNPSNLAQMNIVWNAFFDFDTMSGAAVTACTLVDGNGHFGRRIIDTISSTGFNIQNGSKYNTYAGAPTADNSILILQYVYGREG